MHVEATLNVIGQKTWHSTRRTFCHESILTLSFILPEFNTAVVDVARVVSTLEVPTKKLTENNKQILQE